MNNLQKIVVMVGAVLALAFGPVQAQAALTVGVSVDGANVHTVDIDFDDGLNVLTWDFTTTPGISANALITPFELQSLTFSWANPAFTPPLPYTYTYDLLPFFTLQSFLWQVNPTNDGGTLQAFSILELANPLYALVDIGLNELAPFPPPLDGTIFSFSSAPFFGNVLLPAITGQAAQQQVPAPAPVALLGLGLLLLRLRQAR